MIGRLDKSTREVTIVGAGIAGLLGAYYLDQQGWEVELIEASSRAGGLLSTSSTAFGIVESAAHSLPASPNVKKHFEELGLKLLPIEPRARARYVLRRGKLRRFPLSIWQAFKTFLCAYFRLAPKRDPEELNLKEWAEHFLGESAFQYLITPFTRGIFGAEPEQINVSAAFPALCVPRGHSLISFLLAKKIRKTPPRAAKRAIVSIPRGPISAPENGMGDWVLTLTRHLEKRLGDRFKKNQKIESISGIENLVLAVPAYEASRLLSAISPALSKALAQVTYSAMTTVTVFLDQSHFAHEPQGLGVLIPRVEQKQCLGVLFNSSAFQKRVVYEKTVSFTVMLSGDERTDQEIQCMVSKELRDIFGYQGAPQEIQITRWKRAIPRYDLHLLKTWEIAENSWCSQPGHVLFGNYTGQISLRGMLEVAKMKLV